MAPASGSSHHTLSARNCVLAHGSGLGLLEGGVQHCLRLDRAEVFLCHWSHDLGLHLLAIGAEPAACCGAVAVLVIDAVQLVQHQTFVHGGIASLDVQRAGCSDFGIKLGFKGLGTMWRPAPSWAGAIQIAKTLHACDTLVASSNMGA